MKAPRRKPTKSHRSPRLFGPGRYSVSGTSRASRIPTMIVLLALAAGGLYLLAVPDAGRPPSAPLTGPARAVDGDTLRLAGARIRIVGLDAPELAQTCEDATGAAWPCGGVALKHLAGLIEGQVITCRPQGHDQYGRVLARCASSGGDLGAAMVTAGLAVASGDYRAEEAQARAAKQGIWAGRFQTPRSWRDGAGRDDFWGWISRWFG